MARLRVAIVGAGLMGRWHARYARRGGAELAAVVDPSEPAARALSGMARGASTWAGLEECLASQGIDAVHVCTGSGSHVALAEVALRAGKHVLIEKPVASSAAEVERLVELARLRGVTLAATHQMPFQRGFQCVQRRVGELGELVRIEYRTHTAGGDRLVGDERRALLLEILPHPLSLMRRLCPGVAPTAWDVLDASEDDLCLTARAGRVRLGIVLSLRARPTRNELLVTGQHATARVDLFHGFCVLERWSTSRLDKVLGPFRRGSATVLAAAANLVVRGARREPAYPGLAELIRRFYDAILTSRESPVSSEEMLETALVADRIRLLSDGVEPAPRQP